MVTSLVRGSVPAMNRSLIGRGQCSPASAPVSAQIVTSLIPSGGSNVRMGRPSW